MFHLLYQLANNDFWSNNIFTLTTDQQWDSFPPTDLAYAPGILGPTRLQYVVERHSSQHDTITKATIFCTPLSSGPNPQSPSILREPLANSDVTIKKRNDPWLEEDREYGLIADTDPQ